MIELLTEGDRQELMQCVRREMALIRRSQNIADALDCIRSARMTKDRSMAILYLEMAAQYRRKAARKGAH